MADLDHKMFVLPCCPVCGRGLRKMARNEKDGAELDFYCGLRVFEMSYRVEDSHYRTKKVWNISNSCEASFEIALKSLSDQQKIKNPFVEAILGKND